MHFIKYQVRFSQKSVILLKCTHRKDKDVCLIRSLLKFLSNVNIKILMFSRVFLLRFIKDKYALLKNKFDLMMFANKFSFVRHLFRDMDSSGSDVSNRD